MAPRRVPDRPNLEQYRRQAKDLLRAFAAATPAALDRLQRFHPRGGASAPKLADAQLVLAREHGFASWPAFVAHVRAEASQVADGFPDSLSCEAGPLKIEVAGEAGLGGVVLFVLAGNVGRQHRGTRQIADRLKRAGFCTVLADLLTDEEAIEDAIHEELRFDLQLLKNRAALILDWIGREPRLSERPLALYCAGTGGSVGMLLAAENPTSIGAMVCGASRPDLAGAAAARVRAPTLFVIGGEDAVGHGFTKLVMEIFPRGVASRLELVRGVGLRFEEGPAAARAAELAIAWLDAHLATPEAAYAGEVA
jgi:dienelactone hydrolase